MLKYLLVALDLDGTLLKYDKTVHPDSIKDITQSSKKGINIVYCTGRAPIEIQEYLEILPSIRYGVCLSGALVYDFKENKIIYINSIPKELIEIIIEAAKVDDGMVQFLTEKDSIVRIDQITHMADFNMGVYQPMYLKIAKTVKDMKEELKKHNSIPKVNIYFHTKKACQEAYDKLKHLPLSFSFGLESSLEITAADVTKGNGLSKLASYLGIPMEKIIGIGDGENDRSFLNIVGLSIAMSNASKEIKSICKYITDDNDNNGTGKAIHKYCFEN